MRRMLIVCTGTVQRCRVVLSCRTQCGLRLKAGFTLHPTRHHDTTFTQCLVCDWPIRNFVRRMFNASAHIVAYWPITDKILRKCRVGLSVTAPFKRQTGPGHRHKILYASRSQCALRAHNLLRPPLFKILDPPLTAPATTTPPDKVTIPPATIARAVIARHKFHSYRIILFMSFHELYFIAFKRE